MSDVITLVQPILGLEPYVLLTFRDGGEGDEDLRVSIAAGGGLDTEEDIGAALRLAVNNLPDAPTIEIRRPHDEALEVVVGGVVVAEANHDEHGWSGMDAVEKTALAVARAFGWEPAGTDEAEGGCE